MKEAFVFSVTHNYLTNKISLDYEKYTILNRIDDYFELWGTDDVDELIYILNENIDRYEVMRHLRYINAIEKNLMFFWKCAKSLREVVFV